jgi:hypothetical protein
MLRETPRVVTGGEEQQTDQQRDHQQIDESQPAHRGRQLAA